MHEQTVAHHTQDLISTLQITPSISPTALLASILIAALKAQKELSAKKWIWKKKANKIDEILIPSHIGKTKVTIPITIESLRHMELFKAVCTIAKFNERITRIFSEKIVARLSAPAINAKDLQEMMQQYIRMHPPSLPRILHSKQ